MSQRGRDARRRHRLSRREMGDLDHQRASRFEHPDDAFPRRGRRKKKRSPEDERYRDAKSRANARIGWTVHLICYGSVLALILVSSRSFRATLIVALSWGIGLACHYFAAIVSCWARDLLNKTP